MFSIYLKKKTNQRYRRRHVETADRAARYNVFYSGHSRAGAAGEEHPCSAERRLKGADRISARNIK